MTILIKCVNCSKKTRIIKLDQYRKLITYCVECKLLHDCKWLHTNWHIEQVYSGNSDHVNRNIIKNKKSKRKYTDEEIDKLLKEIENL